MESACWLKVRTEDEEIKLVLVAENSPIVWQKQGVSTHVLRTHSKFTPPKGTVLTFFEAVSKRIAEELKLASSPAEEQYSPASPPKSPRDKQPS